MSSVRVNDREWRKLRARLNRLDRQSVRVGVLSSRGGAATHEESDISIVELAAVHEFGSPKNNIPERSFIRSTFQNEERELNRVTTSLARKLINGKLTHTRALEILGLWGEKAIRSTITTGPHLKPALKTATVARKGSSRPLVDTGALSQSISHQVVRE